mgnify:CR=1 FL=1
MRRRARREEPKSARWQNETRKNGRNARHSWKPRARISRARQTVTSKSQPTTARSRPEDLQDLHRRQIPAPSPAATTCSRIRKGAADREHLPQQPQGFPRSRRRRPAPPIKLGGQEPPTTAARSSTASPRCSEGRARSSSTSSITTGLAASAARSEVEKSIDRVLYYAGWADKYQQIFSSVNPVSSSHFNFSPARADRRRLHPLARKNPA